MSKQMFLLFQFVKFCSIFLVLSLSLVELSDLAYSRQDFKVGILFCSFFGNVLFRSPKKSFVPVKQKTVHAPAFWIIYAFFYLCMSSKPSQIIQGDPLVSQITPRVNIGVFHKDLVRRDRKESTGRAVKSIAPFYCLKYLLSACWVRLKGYTLCNVLKSWGGGQGFTRGGIFHGLRWFWLVFGLSRMDTKKLKKKLQNPAHFYFQKLLNDKKMSSSGVKFKLAFKIYVEQILVTFQVIWKMLFSKTTFLDRQKFFLMLQNFHVY